MAKTTYRGRNLSLERSLFLIYLGSLQPADTHSLSCNYTVRAHPTPPQPCCEGQCSVDGEPFLWYDDDNKATPLGDLGKKAHDIGVWTEMVGDLEVFCKELRKRLADSIPGTAKIPGHPTLQIIILAQAEQGKIIGASVVFNISGKYSFTLNMTNMSWTLISLEAAGIMNDWKKDVDLTVNLKNFIANFNHWLKELLECHRERTRSTSGAPDIIQLRSATQLLPSINITQLPSTINITQLPPTTKVQYEKIFILCGVIGIITIIVFLTSMCVKKKFCTQGDRNLQLPMNCSINCNKPQRKERAMEPSGEFPNQTTKMLSQEDEPQDMQVRAFTKQTSPSPHPRVRRPHSGEKDVREHCFQPDMAAALLDSQQL